MRKTWLISPFLLFIYIISTLSFSASAFTTASTPVPVKKWVLTSHQLVFSLSPEDFNVISKNRPQEVVFSFQQLLQQDKKKQIQEAHRTIKENLDFYLNLPLEQRMMETRLELSPLSAVGPLVSYLQNSFGYWPGSAHPYADQIFITVDTSQNNDQVSLLDLFSEKDLVQGLAQAPFLQKHFKGPNRNFQTLDQLVESLEQPEGGCIFFSREVFLKSFSFQKLQKMEKTKLNAKDKVVLTIGLPYAAGVCRGHLTLMELTLPVPETLKKDLEKTFQEKEGFFMKNREKLGSPTYSIEVKLDFLELAKELKN